MPLAIAGPFSAPGSPGVGQVWGLAAYPRPPGWGWQGALAPASSLFPPIRSTIFFFANYRRRTREVCREVSWN